ncbi:alpha/beta fold hydrolase [Buchnera aphidicola]|uniref:Carboxylesterase n=1 Tax=Buchnera aphidicola subsp. Cinara cedri (strain Cc) TaxID=372461 RepID=Q056Z0_BUCCC|nr:alpha/beta fold hydrolase [Buchnera aphidicola]ABJ90809.1 carboxylesterase [Buchnera aphidicola BCc]
MNQKKKINLFTIEKGKIHLVFFHGWGLNSLIWKKIIPILKKKFTLYFLDFPGYGKNIDFPIMNFNQLSDYLFKKIKKKVILIGWSLGGQFAHYLSFKYPNFILAVIYITYTPFFMKKKRKKKKIFKKIKNDIILNYKKFLYDFINLHILYKKKKNLLYFKKKFSFLKKYPNPKKEAIEIGYKWLTKIDQRKKILSKNIPTLKIYGELDNLISIRIYKKSNNLNNLNKIKKNYYYIIPKARHAPFLSHPKIFCKIINKFIKKL